jgi:hypothetical protein
MSDKIYLIIEYLHTSASRLILSRSRELIMMRRISKGVDREVRHLYDISASESSRIDIAPMMMVK